jgi:ribosomal protein S18 acetylase RimI-like enzyme
MYLEIERDLAPEVKEMLKPFSQVGDKELQAFIKSRFDTKPRSGFFIIDKQGTKNAVVGFLIYSVDNNIGVLTSELHYILVDKEYRGKSFGTQLITQYVKELKRMNVASASAQVDEEENYGWYHKFGFTIKSLGKYGKTYLNCFPNEDTNVNARYIRLAFEENEKNTLQMS